jgi:hypothetical protein
MVFFVVLHYKNRGILEILCYVFRFDRTILPPKNQPVVDFSFKKNQLIGY